MPCLVFARRAHCSTRHLHIERAEHAGQTRTCLARTSIHARMQRDTMQDLPNFVWNSDAFEQKAYYTP